MADNENAEDEDPANGIPKNKKYCCGNETDYEALNISKINIVSGVGQIGVYAASLILITFMPKVLLDLMERQNYIDLINFFSEDKLTIWAVLGIMIIYCIFEIVLGVMLYVAARERDWRKLRKWFFLYVLQTLVYIALTIPVIFFVQAWMKYTGWFIFLFLYKWYGLWIVYLLIGEIKEISGRYVHPGGI